MSRYRGLGAGHESPVPNADCCRITFKRLRFGPNIALSGSTNSNAAGTAYRCLINDEFWKCELKLRLGKRVHTKEQGCMLCSTSVIPERDATIEKIAF